MRLILIILSILFMAGTAYCENPEKNVNRHLINGLLYESEFQFEEAIAEYEKGDDSMAVLSKIASLYNKIGKYDTALGVLKKIIAIDKDNAEAHFDLASTYYIMKRLDDAVVEYEKVFELKPKSIASLNAIGNICQDQGRIDKAIEYYKKAIGINPNYAPVHNDLGSAYYAQGKTEDAIAEYKKSLSLDVNFGLARENLYRAERTPAAGL